MDSFYEQLYSLENTLLTLLDATPTSGDYSAIIARIQYGINLLSKKIIIANLEQLDPSCNVFTRKELFEL